MMMRPRATLATLGVLSLAVVFSPVLNAQQQTTSVDAEHRLFLRFAEDAAIVPSYWLEGQARLDLSLPSVDDSGGDGEADLLAVGPVFAFNVAEDFEFGGRIGLAYWDPDSGDSETGLTDLDVWGKVSVVSDPVSIALGILVKVPTADESKFMGTGELDIEFFAGMRKDFSSFTVAGNLGVRINQDPEFDEDIIELEGEDSVLAGLAIIVPVGAKWALTGEWALETERIEGFKNDSRLLGGVEYRADESFSFRGSLAAGLADGSPDWGATASAVWLF